MNFEGFLAFDFDGLERSNISDLGLRSDIRVDKILSNSVYKVLSTRLFQIYFDF